MSDNIMMNLMLSTSGYESNGNRIDRRPGSLLPGLCLLLLAFLVLFHTAVFSGRVLLPGDLLYFYEPWKTEFSTPEAGPSNWILFDEVLEFYPWRHVMRDALSGGRIPLWDPTAFCGYPFIAVFQTAFLYLPDRLLDPLPFRFYPLIRSFLHILIAGLGTGLYLRRRGFSTGAITLGITGYGFCGFMIVWLGHPHIKVAAWLPWLFDAADQIIIRNRYSRFRLAVIAGLILTAGHIETALHCFTAVALYGLILSAGRHKRITQIVSDALYALPPIFLALLFSAAMALPFAEYLVRSVAYATRANGVVTEPFLDKILAIAQLLPNLFGSSAQGNYWYRGFNSAEVNGGFIGIILLTLSVTAMLRPGVKLFRRAHIALALFCFAVAYGIPVIAPLALHIPGFRMSYNFRLTLPMAFSLIVLGTAQLNDIMSSGRVPWRRLLSVATGFTGLILSVFFWVERIPAAPGISRTSPVKPVEHALLPLGAVLLLLYLFHSHRLSRRRLGLLAGIAVTAELIGFGYGFNPTCPVSALEQTPAVVSHLAVHKSDHPFRALLLGYLLPPHLPALYGIHDVRGNDALTPLVEEDVMAIIEPSIRAPDKLPALRMMWLHTWASPLWDLLNVEWFAYPLSDASPQGIPSHCRVAGGTVLCPNRNALPRVFVARRWERLPNETTVLARMSDTGFDPRETLLLSASDAPPFTAPPVSVNCRITAYQPGNISAEVETDRQTLLVLSETYFPGWKVFVNGTEQHLFRVDHMLQGVFLSPGRWHVRFHYEPVSFRLGLFLTMTALMFMIILWFASASSERLS